MQEQVVHKLLTINQEFYQDFADSFSRTRQRIQHGILLILNDLPRRGNYLDLGCGNGALALEWDRQRRSGLYLGMDFSQKLLDCARKKLETIRMSPNLTVDFFQADLVTDDWDLKVEQYAWNGILAFAVLHHIPSNELRLKLLEKVNGLLVKEGQFIISVWQFQNSPKLLARQINWDQVGLADADVEPGDALLDWRSDVKDESTRLGLRYVHLFSRNELNELAALSGFQILDQFDSDGFNGKLGHYEIWQKKNDE